jgi:KTSC domain
MQKSEMTEVQSGLFSHVHYDPQTETLTVRFHSGRLDAYAPVTEQEYKEFLCSPSIGGHFSQKIRNNGRFVNRQVGVAE